MKACLPKLKSNGENQDRPSDSSSEPPLKLNLSDEEKILELYADSIAGENDELSTYALLSSHCPELTQDLLNGMVARKCERIPDWKTNLLAAKLLPDAFARVAMFRKLKRMDDANYAQGHAKLRIREYAPKQDALPQGNTFNIVMFPSDAKKIVPSEDMRRIIDVKPDEPKPSA